MLKMNSVRGAKRLKEQQQFIAMDAKTIFSLLATLVLVGCQSYPMGLSKEEWEALPPEKQAEYQRQQTLINEQRRKEREAAEAQQRAIAEEQARQEQARLQAMYDHARYGDIVTVTIEGGKIDFGKHYTYEPVRFDILRGEHKLVEFCKQGDSGVKDLIPVYLSDDAQTFIFDESARDRIKIINAGNAWQVGKKYEGQTIMDKYSKSIASGITIQLQYKDPRQRPDPRPHPVKPLTR